jgi:hypothetical protein
LPIIGQRISLEYHGGRGWVLLIIAQKKKKNGEKKDMACLVYPVIIFERNLWRATWLLRKSGAVFFFFSWRNFAISRQINWENFGKFCFSRVN